MPRGIRSLSPVAGLALLLTAFMPLGCAQQTGEVRAIPTSAAGRQAFAQRHRLERQSSGASGHPKMTAAAIRDAAANFEQWRRASRRKPSDVAFRASPIRRIRAGSRPISRSMDLVDAQPEFTSRFREYLDLLVSEERIARGRQILALHRASFDIAEKHYGVDRHIIAAILGIESKYSTVIGERSVVRSTATLARIGRRQDYFRGEFLAALECSSAAT